jgi:hypothetical protein
MDYDTSMLKQEDLHLTAHVQECIVIAQYAAVEGHSRVSEEDPDISDPEQRPPPTPSSSSPEGADTLSSRPSRHVQVPRAHH